MAERVEPIARIRLARSTPRLLAVPALMAVAGVAIAAAALLTLAAPSSFAGAGVGAVLVLWGVVLGTRPLSVRLEVEEAAIRLRWLGGERRYPLVPGPVTRVRFAGENASRLRARSPHFGLWQLGEARLRDEEEIHVVRLAPTPSAILVPTQRGRLAIAAADEEQLLDALSAAARARQALEERAELAMPPADLAEPPEAVERPEPEPEPEPMPLTGIERALLEQRLAEERAAAEAAALADGIGAPAEAPEPSPPAPAEVEPMPAPERRRARLRPPRIGAGRLPRPRPSVAFVVLPLLGAGIAWGVGLATGRMPVAGSDLARLTILALVLSGPATSVAAIMALAWWPRIVGVVVAGGLAGSLFVGRALLG